MYNRYVLSVQKCSGGIISRHQIEFVLNPHNGSNRQFRSARGTLSHLHNSLVERSEIEILTKTDGIYFNHFFFNTDINNVSQDSDLIE